MHLASLILKLGDMLRDLAPDNPRVTLIVNGVEHPLDEVWYYVSWLDGVREVTVCIGYDPR